MVKFTGGLTISEAPPKKASLNSISASGDLPIRCSIVVAQGLLAQAPGGDFLPGRAMAESGGGIGAASPAAAAFK